MIVINNHSSFRTKIITRNASFLARVCVLFLFSRRSCDAWLSPSLKDTTFSTAAVRLVEEDTTRKVYRADDTSHEPAGVASLIFSRPRSVRASFVSRARRANNLRKWIIRRRRRRRRQGIIELTDQDQIAVSQLDIPEWACTDDTERHKLAMMKALVQEDLDRLKHLTVENTNVQVMQAFPDVYGDLRLLRFLRKDRIQNPVSAASRYRSFLRWRQEGNVDAVRWHVEHKPFCPPQHLENMLKGLVPCEFNVSEGGGDDTVPALLYAGEWDTATIMRLIQQDKLSVSSFLLYWTHIFESLNLKLHDEMMKRKKMVYVDEVCCLRGMRLEQFSPGFVSAVLKPWLKLTQSNYPETSKRIILLNPPKIISLIWNIAAPMASPGTVAKVQMNRDFNGSCLDYVRKSN